MKKARKSVSIIFLVFAMVAMLLTPTAKTVKADDYISEIALEIEAPKCGDEITAELYDEEYEYYDWATQTPRPSVSVPSGSNYGVDGNEHYGDYVFWVNGDDDLFVGTYEAGDTFYVEIELYANEGWTFDGDASFDIPGCEVVSYSAYLDWCYLIVSGTVGKIDEVSLKVTPPKCGDEVTIEWEEYEDYKYVRGQTPQPAVEVPSDAPYALWQGNGNHAYYLISGEDEVMDDNIFEGKYDGGDTFYAVVCLVIPSDEPEPLPEVPVVKAKAETDYYFAEDLTINIEGATVIRYEVNNYGRDQLIIYYQGTVDACEIPPEPEPEPQPDPKPIPTPPYIVPNTSVK